MTSSKFELHEPVIVSGHGYVEFTRNAKYLDRRGAILDALEQVSEMDDWFVAPADDDGTVYRGTADETHLVIISPTAILVGLSTPGEEAAPVELASELMSSVLNVLEIDRATYVGAGVVLAAAAKSTTDLADWLVGSLGPSSGLPFDPFGGTVSDAGWEFTFRSDGEDVGYTIEIRPETSDSDSIPQSILNPDRAELPPTFLYTEVVRHDSRNLDSEEDIGARWVKSFRQVKKASLRFDRILREIQSE